MEKRAKGWKILLGHKSHRGTGNTQRPEGFSLFWELPDIGIVQSTTQLGFEEEPSQAEGRGEDTYSHDEEIQPAPGVGEEFHKSIGTPLQQHLQDENVSEHLVCILQDGPDGFPLLDVNILKSLEITRCKCHYKGFIAQFRSFKLHWSEFNVQL